MIRKYILSFALFCNVGLLFSQSLSIHPVPRQIMYSKHNDTFTVQVRIPGEEWQDLFEYNVQVDMDTRSDASMVQFDFAGQVELRAKLNNGTVREAIIRPLNKGVEPVIKGNIIYCMLDKPAKLSLEINGDRLHNLHIFANEMEKEIPDADAPGVIYFSGGIHKPDDLPGNAFHIPSNTTVYLAPGAVIQGKLVCNRVENVRFLGRGIILQPERGFELTHSRNIEIEGITVINPDHYTVYGGEVDGLKISNLKSFSARGWSDGIDLMSCSNVTIDDVFMRNSDDCIAIYGHRWNFYGDARDYKITNAILWADVAHPINIGLHGDTSHKGNTIENLYFSEIDILEHDEDDRDYQGCIAFSVSDHNLVQNVTFENIRVEHIQEGQLFNLRVLYNEKYSTGPGRGIKNVSFRNIEYYGSEENPSVLEGYSRQNKIEDITYENIVINGKRITDFEAGNIRIGNFTENITIK